MAAQQRANSARQSKRALTWHVSRRGCIRGAWAKWAEHSGPEYCNREGPLGPLGQCKYNRRPPLIKASNSLSFSHVGLIFLFFFARHVAACEAFDLSTR